MHPCVTGNIYKYQVLQMTTEKYTTQQVPHQNLSAGTPSAEIEIDIDLARQLLLTQHPDFASLPITYIGSGWDNAIFRLGETLALRLPRRQSAAKLLQHEQHWLPVLKNSLPLSVPIPIRIGVPQKNYRWPWSIVPWIEGETADLSLLDSNQGEVLGVFFDALHKPAPKCAPHNPYRGVPLSERAHAFYSRIQNLSEKTVLIDDRIRTIWTDALSAPIDTPPTWIHGDLHPRNVLAFNGHITGIIDWGDMARGDQASDLAAIWMLFPSLETRIRAMASCNFVSAATWRRARGWAALFGVVLLDTGLINDPPMAAIATKTFKHLIQGP